MGHASAKEKDKPFVRVDWGKTMSLFGPESVEAQFVRVKITEYGPGIEHKRHRHSDQEEVIYVLEGRGISRTDAGDQPMEPGTFVFIPADTDHTTINLERDRPLKAIIIKAPPGEAER